METAPEYGIDTIPKELKLAERIIQTSYGDVVSVLKKGKSLSKFGRRDDMDTTTKTIAWLAGEDNETYVTGNTITHVVSSNVNDTEPVKIEGHTRSGLTGDLTFVVQEVTLTGQTGVALPTPLHRATRAYNNTTAGTDLLGNVYVYEGGATTLGVPDDLTTVHVGIPALALGSQQSQKASTSLSSEDYWIITGFNGYATEKTAAVVDFHIEIRRPGNVWRIANEITAGQQDASIAFDVPIIVPPNSDIRITGHASTTGVEAYAQIRGYLATIVS